MLDLIAFVALFVALAVVGMRLPGSLDRIDPRFWPLLSH